ncbi:MAG: hypothetical protein K9M97_12580, partial [Akkermansiaceae bacterium]|nr:hypothetical protein [Akkermansiaceae bacterium]
MATRKLMIRGGRSKGSGKRPARHSRADRCADPLTIPLVRRAKSAYCLPRYEKAFILVDDS